MRRDQAMSCYFRHLKDIMAEAGIEVTLANKKDVDRALHEIVGVAYKDCPSAWKNLKQQMANEADRAVVVKKLRKALSK
jgi:tetrahydromethanopterin S-methyltransferase subunit H